MKKVEITREMYDKKTTTIFCDRCGTEVKDKPYNMFSCDIEYRKGSRDGYEGVTELSVTTVDLCEPCSDFVFLELFPKNNINVSTESI